MSATPADILRMSGSPAAFHRRQLKERRRAFRNHWPLFIGVVGALSVAAGGIIYLLMPERRVPAWAVAPIAIVSAFWAMRSQFDGTYHLQSGIEAENWTSRDLKKALGRGWYVIDWISFGAAGDADHVVVGPSGIWVIESKYTDSTLETRRGRGLIASWIEQSHENARRVALLLKHNYGRDFVVHSLVVVSGSESVKLPAALEDVAVLRRRNVGRMATTWRTMPPVLSGEQVESIRAALLDWRGLRENYERDRGA